MHTFKNVIFDIGNVIVKWSPNDIFKQTFTMQSEAEAKKQAQLFFKNPIWIDLNLGKLTEAEAKNLYITNHGYDQERMNILFNKIKTTQILIEGTQDILRQLHGNYDLYALSDNVIEIVAYLRDRYNFFDYFKGVVISAEVGMMKPNHEIFHYLLHQFSLLKDETVFIDDHGPNVDAARQIGILSIQFQNADQCITQLQALGLVPLSQTSES